MVSPHDNGTETRAVDIYIDSRNARSIVNPVLILEGLDFDEGTDDEVTARSLFEQLDGNQFLAPLVATGHDIITLNFQRSTSDIFQNGAFVSGVLEYLSSRMPVASTNGIKVIGLSMGGLVGRIAVKQYEDKRGTTAGSALKPIDLYLSFDSPHQGANVPYSVRTVINQWATNGVLEDENLEFVQRRNALLNSTSTNQMSLRGADGSWDGGWSDNPVAHQQFM